MNIFQEVKDRVTARMAAEHYGIKVNNKGMVCCSFHDDHHPSMKIDKNFYCFACGERGDAIAFTARMFGLSQLEAAKKLNEDFSLGIANVKKSKKKRLLEKKERINDHTTRFVQKKLDEWTVYAIDVLTNYLKWIEFWKEIYEPETIDEEWHDLFAEVLNNEGKINYYLDILMFGDRTEIWQFFKEKHEEVKKFETKR